MTISILAIDEKTGRMGGAAATGSLCVGGWVLRGRAEDAPLADDIARAQPGVPENRHPPADDRAGAAASSCLMLDGYGR